MPQRARRFEQAAGAPADLPPTVKPDARLDRDQSLAAGKQARLRTPLESLGDFVLEPNRDPITLLIEQDATRVPDLVPVRHGRMMVSPFTFYRGAALPMAADLATAPSSGLWTQLCGDAHLSNFGAFGSPERRLVFDINDFDETLPGPFEWDVKRLLASMAVAGRSNGFSTKQRRKILLDTASAYRTTMAQFANMPMLAVWYAHFDVEQWLTRDQLSKEWQKRAKTAYARALSQDDTRALSKLTTVVDGERQILSNPPLLVPGEELAQVINVEETYASIRAVYEKYADSLPPDRRDLVRRYRVSRIARKVVGVGSVGTQAWVLLMEPLDGLEPLLLQAKQATTSVLAPYLAASEFENQGQRVTTGQWLMQAATDVFLGWQRADGAGLLSNDYYIRQLRDWKFSVVIENLDPQLMGVYGGICGWTLARAHARTGNRIAVARYLGNKPTFEETLADFAERYADQTEKDHAALVAAVRSGRVTAQSGV